MINYNNNDVFIPLLDKYPLFMFPVQVNVQQLDNIDVIRKHNIKLSTVVEILNIIQASDKSYEPLYIINKQGVVCQNCVFFPVTNWDDDSLLPDIPLTSTKIDMYDAWDNVLKSKQIKPNCVNNTEYKDLIYKQLNVINKYNETINNIVQFANLNSIGIDDSEFDNIVKKYAGDSIMAKKIMIDLKQSPQIFEHILNTKQYFEPIETEENVIVKTYNLFD